ncbi:MAG: hypothetical protein ABI333_01780 [bacterium]
MSVRALVTAAVLALSVGPMIGCKAKRKVKCSRLCKRMGSCFSEVLHAQGKLNQSTIRALKEDKTVRKKLKHRVGTYCKSTCKKYNKRRKWSKKDVRRVEGCLNKGSCRKFAKCITSVL